MTQHRYDRRKVDEERQAQIDKAIHWHNQINRDLAKHGLPKENNMYNAIHKAEQHNIIGTNTYQQAQQIRHAGNDARHKY